MKEANGQTSPPRGTVLIGVGNEYRRDDGVGLQIIRKLDFEGSDSVRTMEIAGDPAELMEAWEQADSVYVFDAVHGGQHRPGRVFRFRAHDQPLPGSVFSVSTHGFGVPEAVELSRQMGELPETLLVYGVVGEEFGSGTTLSPAVSRAADRVVREVKRDLNQERTRRDSSCTNRN